MNASKMIVALLTVLFVSLAFTGDGRAYPRIYAGSQCESYYYSDREYMSRSNGRIENGKTGGAALIYCPVTLNNYQGHNYLLGGYKAYFIDRSQNDNCYCSMYHQDAVTGSVDYNSVQSTSYGTSTQEVLFTDMDIEWIPAVYDSHKSSLISYIVEDYAGTY